jgi:hypothetical protein
MTSTAPAGYGTVAHYLANPGSGQTIADETGACDLWRGPTEAVETSDVAWGDGYTSIGDSGPVAWAREHLPHWTWEWLALLFPGSAWAATPEVPHRYWVYLDSDDADVRAAWPLESPSLGQGAVMLYGAAEDTVRVHGHPFGADDWGAVTTALAPWLVVTSTGAPPDSLKSIPMEW